MPGGPNPRRRGEHHALSHIGNNVAESTWSGSLGKIPGNGKKLNNLHGKNWVFAFVFMVGNSLARPQTHPQKRLVVFWQPSIRLDSIEDGSLFSIRNIDK